VMRWLDTTVSRGRHGISRAAAADCRSRSVTASHRRRYLTTAKQHDPARPSSRP